MTNSRRSARRYGRGAGAGAVAAVLVGCLSHPAWAEPRPVIPSAAEVAAAQAAAGTAAQQVAAIDAQLASARASVETAMDDAEEASEAYNQAAEQLEQAREESRSATERASAASVVADRADLALSRYAAEVFQGGSGTGQLEVFFGGGGPGQVLDRAAGIDAVGQERARLLAEAQASRQLADTLRQVADEAAARQATATVAAQSAMDVAKARAGQAQDLAAAVSAQQDQAVTRLAGLRQTSVQLERDRQVGLAALEAARRAEEARRRAEAEAARQRAEAARQAELARRAEQARQAELARQDAVRNQAQTKPSTTPKPAPKPTPTPAPATNPGAPRGGVTAVLAFARAQLGEPYVWGGAGPNVWDCSGLTMVAWQQAGVRMSHGATVQYQQTRRVLIADLQPGDLVFFGNSTTYIGHVGIYIGGGQMIHAPHTGDVVRIASIYRKNLLPYGGRP